MTLRPLASFTRLLAVVALAACGGKGTTTNTGTGALSVWTQGVARKIQPTTAPGSGAAVSVATCRKAWASWQLVVRGKGHAINGVTVGVDADLSDGDGHTLAKSNVTFFREHFIDLAGIMSNTGNMPVPASSPTSDTSIPDPLIPLVDPYTGANAGQPFDVPSDRNQPVFIDVFVPAGTTAGTYTGSIHVSDAGGDTADIPLSVTVWDLDLPDMGSVKTHFKMSINSLYEYHKGVAKCSGGNCYLDVNQASLALVRRYEDLAHEHRIDTGQQLVQAPGVGCTVPTATEWKAYDIGMTPYLDGSHFSDGVPSGHFDVPFRPGQNYGVDGTCGPGSPTANQAAYSALAQAWAAHLRSKGWFEKAIAYAYDEPPMGALPNIAMGSAWLQKGDPGWKARVMDTLAPNASNASQLSSAIGIYTVSLPLYGSWSGVYDNYGRAEWPSLFAQGTELWLYTANAVLPPYPTISTDTLDGFEPLIQLWGAWFEKATGFLYWDTTSWDDKDPWGPTNKWYLPGDGVMIYPGNHDGTLSPVGSPADVAIDGPVASYRLKVLRQGLQDWALFRLADEKGLTSVVQQQVSTVYTQLGGCTTCPLPASGFNWKTDDAAMAAAREAVVQAILQ
jgi:hypothetical protein